MFVMMSRRIKPIYKPIAAIGMTLCLAFAAVSFAARPPAANVSIEQKTGPADRSDRLNLTKEEKAWLKKPPHHPGGL